MMKMIRELGNDISKAFYLWASQREINEIELLAQSFLQIVVLKLRTISSLSKGTTLMDDLNRVHVPDILSINAVSRSLYEYVFIFHNYFVAPKTDVERLILIKIWQIRGLNIRQIMVEEEEYKNKVEQEAEAIQGTLLDIENLLNRLEITQKARAKVINVAQDTSNSIKGYSFIRQCDSNQIIDFTQKSFTKAYHDLFAIDDFKPIYAYLSSNAHPSYLGILQFGQMYKEDDCQDLLKTILQLNFLSAIKFIEDFYIVVPSFKKYFKEEQLQSYYERM